ncbi:MAG: methyltransferase family protein [Candidatus Promineifilaceae bacterium]
MNENVFRLLAGLIFFAGLGISAYFRRKADRESEEKVSRDVDGAAMKGVIQAGGLLLWLTPIVYLLNPNWMAWSSMGLPTWARWIGIGLGLFCDLAIYWLFSIIGRGITPTSATRAEHRLVTSGPYRWVRHPLYTIGTTFFFAFGLMADNWFIMLLGLLTFVVMVLRTPKEEANLIDKFGDAYEAYRQTTGRFLPKLGG